jgi:DNA-binding CsgD family transcriptional regulator
MKDEILKLRKKGYTYNQIVEKLNCSKSTVSYHCSKLDGNDLKKKLNISKKETKSFLLEIEQSKINEVVKLRKNKKSYEEIIEITNLNKYQISKICRENNLIKSRKFGNKFEYDIETITKIKKLYNELKSTRKVAKRLGISRYYVMKYVDIITKKKLPKTEKKKNNSKNVISWRRRTKIKLVKYKGGKCVKCGYDKCIHVLQFHHLDPNEKDFTISGKSWSFERLKKEVDKCILVCSNCHIELHNL